MDIFESRVAGIPCQIEVLTYYPARPMRVTGSGYGDADPPEDEFFEYQLLDRKGYLAPWLEKKLTQDDEARLLSEYKESLKHVH